MNKTYGDFPTIEQIKSDYNELMELIKDIRTIDDAKEFADKHHITIEVNGTLVDDIIKNREPHHIVCVNSDGVEEGIEWIRYENYGCLSYIYDRFDGSPMFDIWSHKLSFDFVCDITIDEVTEENYEKWIKEYENPINETLETSIEELWEAACSGNIERLKEYYRYESDIINRRYVKFGREHSLIMGAFRNNQFETIDYLINVGETITEQEKEEMRLELKKNQYMNMLSK